MLGREVRLGDAVNLAAVGFSSRSLPGSSCCSWDGPGDGDAGDRRQPPHDPGAGRRRRPDDHDRPDDVERARGLSGAILAQYQGFADIQMGIGMIVWGLASVILGQALVGTGGLGLSITGPSWARCSSG